MNDRITTEIDTKVEVDISGKSLKSGLEWKKCEGHEKGIEI